MSNWEHQLLSRIVRAGQMNDVLQWGITHKDFVTSEGRGLFQAVLGYHQMPESLGSVLGPNAVQMKYPHFHLCDDPSMTTDALCMEVRKNRMKSELRESLINVAEVLEHDPQVAIDQLSGTVSYMQNLGMANRTDVYAADAMGRIMQTYALKEQGVDMSICPWPWHPMQEATGGIEKDDYIVFYGRPKSMKSWVLAKMLAWCWNQRKRVLVYTKEMTADNIFMRVAATLAGVRYHEFRRAKLSVEEKMALNYVWREIDALAAVQPMVCLSGKDAGEGGDTVPWLRSKVELHKPDLVFIDGVYLMSDTRGGAKQKDNFRVQNISRDIRRMVLDMGVPVIATLQATRAAAKNEEANLDEIAFSDAIGQDATNAIRVINERDKPTIALLVGGSREFELDGFRIFGIPATNFDYFGPLSPVDVQRAVSNDVNDSGTSKAGPPPDKKAARSTSKASSGDPSLAAWQKQYGV